MDEDCIEIECVEVEVGDPGCITTTGTFTVVSEPEPCVGPPRIEISYDGDFCTPGTLIKLQAVGCCGSVTWFTNRLTGPGTIVFTPGQSNDCMFVTVSEPFGNYTTNGLNIAECC